MSRLTVGHKEPSRNPIKPLITVNDTSRRNVVSIDSVTTTNNNEEKKWTYFMGLNLKLWLLKSYFLIKLVAVLQLLHSQSYLVVSISTTNRYWTRGMHTSFRVQLTTDSCVFITWDHCAKTEPLVNNRANFRVFILSKTTRTVHSIICRSKSINPLKSTITILLNNKMNQIIGW